MVIKKENAVVFCEMLWRLALQGHRTIMIIIIIFKFNQCFIFLSSKNDLVASCDPVNMAACFLKSFERNCSSFATS